MDAELLAQVPLFAGLSADELERCAAGFEEVEILSDHNVVREGDYGYSFFVVLDGEIDVHQEFDRIATLQAGDFFGEMALETGEARNAHVATRSRARLAKLMNWDFRTMCEEFPVIAERIQATIAERTPPADSQ